MVVARHRTAWPALLLGMGLAALATGCARRGGSVPYDASLLSVPDPRPAALPYALPLGPLDAIHVTVLNVPALSGDFQIDAQGLVDLPLLGAVKARDLDQAGFARQLEQLYGRRYLNDPAITVRVIQTSATEVTVEGGVRAPGSYPLTRESHLLTAIALAHGIDPDNGNPRRCVVFRKQGGRTVAAAFDLKDIRQGKMVDPLIYPGDTIVVEADTLRQLYRDLVQTLPAVAIFNQL